MTSKAMAAAATAARWTKLGAASGAMAILLGAFGAHALQRRVSDVKMLKNWETAAHYQLVHSVVLLVVAHRPRPMLPGMLIATGTLLFSGSLYAMVLTDQRKFGAVTPIGGVALVAGWLALLL